MWIGAVYLICGPVRCTVRGRYSIISLRWLLTHLRANTGHVHIHIDATVFLGPRSTRIYCLIRYRCSKPNAAQSSVGKDWSGNLSPDP